MSEAVVESTAQELVLVAPRRRLASCATRFDIALSCPLGALRESNWKRTVRWSASIAELGYPTLRVHNLRHTAASIWLGQGADPKVVQAVLRHATAAMTMDLYGHVVASNLLDAAQRIGGTSGARPASVTALGSRNDVTPGR